MKLPKYKQPMLDIYNSTDFSGLTNEEKDCYDKVFFDSLKSPYCMVPADCIKEYKDRQNVIKALVDKGFVAHFCVENLLIPTIIAEVLNERRKEMQQRRSRRKA